MQKRLKLNSISQKILWNRQKILQQPALQLFRPQHNLLQDTPRRVWKKSHESEWICFSRLRAIGKKACEKFSWNSGFQTAIKKLSYGMLSFLLILQRLFQHQRRWQIRPIFFVAFFFYGQICFVSNNTRIKKRAKKQNFCLRLTLKLF